MRLEVGLIVKQDSLLQEQNKHRKVFFYCKNEKNVVVYNHTNEDSKIPKFGDMAELADALDLGSSPQGCRFNSCYPHQTKKRLYSSLFFLFNHHILLWLFHPWSNVVNDHCNNHNNNAYNVKCHVDISCDNAVVNCPK